MDAKPTLTLRLIVAAVSTALVIDPVVFAYAQQPPASGKTFSQQLVQVLMASTYPLEVVEAMSTWASSASG